MARLHELIGTEAEFDVVAAALRAFVAELNPAVVGAYQVLCSDESERECAEAFRRRFVAEMLPELKPAGRAAFLTANLGARYEWGAVHIAEEHYRRSDSSTGLRLLIVKINSHVAVRTTSNGLEFGWLDRYGCESACCGALAALMEGSQLPAVRELAQLFAADGRNRVGALHDPAQVPLEQRALRAAIANASLQAQRAALDIEEHRPLSPAMFLVLPCVTLNRAGADSELVVGQWGIDWTENQPQSKYRGLGSDPAAYHVDCRQGRLLVTDTGDKLPC